jgi:hypothetical protein
LYFASGYAKVSLLFAAVYAILLWRELLFFRWDHWNRLDCSESRMKNRETEPNARRKSEAAAVIPGVEFCKRFKIIVEAEG